MTLSTFLKHITLLVVASGIYFLIHSYGLITYIELDGIEIIKKQHLFLFSITLFIYLSTVMIDKVSPKNTGFVFLGLLLAKMIIAGLFLYNIGWLEENTPVINKVIFLIFYFLYTLVLVLLCIKILKGLGASD